ncbi:hypothetical protein BBJ28_00016251 [Nothophytophthora sp. Chile5]|nr:hypothetical protein BBJ28_00016251 [Nothophytophthora sp. Chile5]
MAGKRKRFDAASGAKAAVAGASGKLQHAHKKHKSMVAKSAVAAAAQKKQERLEKQTLKATPSANSNWLALKSKIQQQNHHRPAAKGGKTVEKKHDLDVRAHKQRAKQEKQTRRQQERTAEWVDNSRIVAMDCEMVGVGLSGKTSVLARCSIVDYDGAVLYDKYVRPVEKVTDYRTHVSGIRANSLRHAIPFAQCLKEVGKLMKDKIVVGHAIKNDFQALMFTPPKHLIRDTAYYRPYMRRKVNGTVRYVRLSAPLAWKRCDLLKLYPKSLKHLTEELLGKEIQGGQHDSVEDARATLDLYKREQFAWEKYLRTSKSGSSLVGVAPALPQKEDEQEDVHQSAQLTAAEKVHLDSDDEDATTGRGSMIIPDSKELAILEYGE